MPLLLCMAVSIMMLLAVERANCEDCPLDFGGLDNKTPFGRSMLKHFSMDEGLVNVNHGSYGATPVLVQRCQDYWRRRAEANPDRWLRYELPSRLEHAAAQVAKYLKVEDSKDVALVPNLSAGFGAVLNSLKLNSTDVIVYFSEAYGSLKLAIQYKATMSGAQHIEIPIVFPPDQHEILTSLDVVLKNFTSRVKMVLVSHVTSVPVGAMPVQHIVNIGRRRNVMVVVDGSNAIGNVPVDLRRLDPDVYVAAGNRWLFAPSGAGFIYAHKRVQPDLHPVVISWNYNAGFQAEFHQLGTLDYSSFLAFPAALKFRQTLDDDRIMLYNRDLATYAGRTLANVWDTDVLEASLTNDPAVTPSMVNVRLPVNDSILVHTMVERLLLAHRTFLATFVDRGRWYARISAQVYNERLDFDDLAKHVLEAKRLLEYPVTNAYPYCVKRP